MDRSDGACQGESKDKTEYDDLEEAGFWKKVKRAAGLITIEPSILLHVTAFYMGNINLSNLLIYKACNINLGHNETFCEELVDKPGGGSYKNKIEEEAQEIVAGTEIWTSVIDNSFPILYVLFLGAWSDTYGRKLPYLVTISGHFVVHALLILATYSSWNTQVVAIAATLPIAVTGGSTAIVMIVYSYIADTTSVRDRSLKMAIATGVLTVGNSMGSAIGGQMANAGLGYYTIFGIVTAMDVASFLLGWVTIKDKRNNDLVGTKSKYGQFVAIFDLRHTRDSALAFFRKRVNGHRARLFLLVIAAVVAAIPNQPEASLMYNFTRIQVGWDAGKFGTFSTFRIAMVLIGGLTSVAIVSPAIGLSDAVLGIVASLSQIGSSFVYAFAFADWMMYLAPVVDMLNGAMTIAARALISKIIPLEETGKVNSIITVMHLLVRLPAAPIYSALYRATLDTMAGAIFLFSATVTVPGLLVFVFLTCVNKRDEDSTCDQQ